MSHTIVDYLRQRNLRVTRPRLQIFETLKTSDMPLSIVEIAKRNPNIDPVSVYRTINLFVSHSITTYVVHGWKRRYELATPFRPHHHHIVCGNCDAVREITSPAIEAAIAKLANDTDFKMTSHVLELHGICHNCR